MYKNQIITLWREIIQGNRKGKRRNKINWCYRSQMTHLFQKRGNNYLINATDKSSKAKAKNWLDFDNTSATGDPELSCFSGAVG